jgi:hypothetical protein
MKIPTLLDKDKMESSDLHVHSPKVQLLQVRAESTVLNRLPKLQEIMKKRTRPKEISKRGTDVRRLVASRFANLDARIRGQR